MSKRTKGLTSYSDVQEYDAANIKSATRLVTMLFDKALRSSEKRIAGPEGHDNQAFHQSALHALQIVLSLRFVLDTESGSELGPGSPFGTYTTIAASLKKP